MTTRKAPAVLIVTLIIFSTLVVVLPEQPAEADCVSYSATSRTIRVTCNTTFAHVTSHITDPTVLTNQGSGQYVLNANLQIDNGVRLTITFAQASWLKIASAYGLVIFGYLDMDGVKVTSWDSAAGSVIDNSGTGPRAFIQWRGGDGGLIKNSEFAYLGFPCSGCSFKRGVSMETYSGIGTHDVTMRNNVFHHIYYAYYSNSAYNIVLDDNEFHSNHSYNIDPHTGTHDMQITNNHIHSTYGTGIICSLDCYNILIEGNKIHDFTSGNKVGISFSRNMHDSIVRNNEITNMATGIAVSESPNNEIYGNIINGVTRGIYFTNPADPDDGFTQNNNAHDNTINNAQYAIISVRSPTNIVSNNNIGTVSSYEYSLDYGSGLTIQDQQFSYDRIRGVNGVNTITIRNSGLITVSGTSQTIDTDASPYQKSLTSQMITVNSGAADTTRPVIKIMSPSEGQSFAPGSILVKGTASDPATSSNSGVKTVQVRVDSGTYHTATPKATGDWSEWSITLQFTTTGTYRIVSRATDNAGNQMWNDVNIMTN